MKAYIINKKQIPYGGGFHYTDPNSGMDIFGTTFQMVIDRTVEHRRANGYPIGLGLVDEIEEQLCLTYPNECTEGDGSIPRKTQHTLQDIVNGTRVMLAFKSSGSNIVSREEAERRAKICIGCPYNASFIKPCSGICQELRSLVNWIIDQQGTQYDSKLHSCNLCGCFLQASIWLRLEDQCVGVTNEMRDKFKFTKERYNCWKDCP